MCKDLGFNVYYQTTVGDNHDRFKECLDVAFKRGANCVHQHDFPQFPLLENHKYK